MLTVPTNAPGVSDKLGVTGAPGEPVVVGVHGLPCVDGETGYRVPVPSNRVYRVPA